MSDSDSEFMRRQVLAGVGATGLTLLGLEPGTASGPDSPDKKPADPMPPARKPKPRARDLGIPLDGTPEPGTR
jgi:hypothetical protein